MAASETTVTVNVQKLGAPLAGARVTLLKPNDEYRSVLTDVLGNAVLDFRCDSAGPVQVTVTAYDCIPYEGTLQITNAVGALLVEGTPIIDDNASGGTVGNANGIIEVGETIDLRIPVINRGVNAYGTAQEYLLLQRELSMQRYDLVIFLFFFNDVANNTDRRNGRRPVFTVAEGQLVAPEEPALPPMRRLDRQMRQGDGSGEKAVNEPRHRLTIMLPCHERRRDRRRQHGDQDHLEAQEDIVGTDKRQSHRPDGCHAITSLICSLVDDVTIAQISAGVWGYFGD